MRRTVRCDQCGVWMPKADAVRITHLWVDLFGRRWSVRAGLNGVDMCEDCAREPLLVVDRNVEWRSLLLALPFVALAVVLALVLLRL